MKNFTKILTLYSSPKEQNISFLHEQYSNIALLKEKIIIVGDGILNNPEVIRGKNILLKPNWVLHNRKPDDEICLRTNDEFIMAALEVILEQQPDIFVIGDVPVQSCNWAKMLCIESLSRK